MLCGIRIFVRLIVSTLRNISYTYTHTCTLCSASLIHLYNINLTLFVDLSIYHFFKIDRKMLEFLRRCTYIAVWAPVLCFCLDWIFFSLLNTNIAEHFMQASRTLRLCKQQQLFFISIFFRFWHNRCLNWFYCSIENYIFLSRYRTVEIFAFYCDQCV